MQTLSLSEDLIKKIIDDPSLLSNPVSINLSAELATSILENGYVRGFRLVFLLNASLSALATITSIVMIKHKNLTREDDERLKREGRGEQNHDEEKGKIDDEHDEKITKSERTSEDVLASTTDHSHA
jgi:hypothetical protein